MCNSQTIVILAEVHTGLAGFVILAQVRRRQGIAAYIATIDVHPAHRRHGLATLLMQHAERSAEALTARSISLHVWTENSIAIDFYEHFGYRRTRLISNYYDRTMHAWLYRKLLPAGDHDFVKSGA